MNSVPVITEEPIQEAGPDQDIYSLINKIDLDGFLAELKEMRQEIEASLGPDDIRHLQKIENWGLLSGLIGTLTAGIAPNLFSAAALSLGRSTRWLLMHHIGHRGYDTVPGIPKRYTSQHFARGIRRFIDWPDWMTPESWKYEHNVLHHSHTGEARDPDLMERNSEAIRNSSLPMPVRYATMLLLSMTWKYSYYAPSNLQALRNRFEPEGSKPDGLIEWDKIMKELILECYLPYSVLMFVVFPALFLPLGPWAVFSAACNSLVAEAIANMHGFGVITPNHTAEDIYRFDSKPANRAERYFRQIIGSVNYKCGDDLTDYLQFWLNYQIEHHIWPDLPMLKYQQVQPRVKALCEKYNVPYLQEDVFIRIKKMLDITVGKTSMKRFS